MSLIHETLSHEIAKQLAPYWGRRTETLVTKDYQGRDAYIVNPRSGRKPLQPFAKAYPCPTLEELFFEMPQTGSLQITRKDDGKFYLSCEHTVLNPKSCTSEKVGDVVAYSIILEGKIVK